MKKFFCLLLSFLLICFAGCSSDNTEVSMDVSALALDLRDSVPYEDDIAEIKQVMVSMLYDIEAEDIAKAIVYISSGATAEEIAVIQATDENSAKTIKESLEERIETQKNSFEDYRPDELSKLDNAILTNVGIYVILSVSSDKDSAEAIINKYIN